ncbi:hypothetical protein V2W45_1324565 [Cenococcum geophilum]
MTSDPLEDDAKVQKAFAAYTAHEFPSAARHFHAKYNRVKNRVNGLPTQPGLPAYNLLLTPHKEKALLI